MKKDKRGRLSRRQFVKAAGSALAVGALPGLACGPGAKKAPAAAKTLRILQWSHFVPGYDKWFDGVYTKEWGARHGTEVIVDHMAATEVNARGAAEAAARKGHDLFLFISPPAAYEAQVIDHSEIVDEVERQHGKMIPLAQKSTLNPKSGKYFAFSDSYVPDPGNYRIDLWSDVGFPNGPDTWEDLRAGGRKIKEKFGNPVGLGLSQEMDSNMAVRGLLWSFGGAEQDESGNVVLNSKETVAALEFMRALYKETETPEIFTWDPSSNNRMMLAGRASFIQNAISVTRTAEKENPAHGEEDRPRAGAEGARAADRRRARHELLRDLEVRREHRRRQAVPRRPRRQLRIGVPARASSTTSRATRRPSRTSRELLANDPKADPPGKYKALSGVLDWATNVGYPGYATAATDEVFNTFVHPDDVRARRPRRDHRAGGGGGGAEGAGADLREVAVSGAPHPVPRPAGRGNP